MKFHRPSRKAYSLNGLANVCAKRFGMSPEKVREIAVMLWEANAISYPLTSDNLVWDENLKDAPLVLDAICKWSPELADQRRFIDPQYVSSAWAKPQNAGEHGGIIPRSTVAPAAFTDDQKKLFHVICERYLDLFDPHKSAAEHGAEEQYRHFSALRHVSKMREFLGTSFLVFGPPHYVENGRVHIAVTDSVPGNYDSWLVVPIGLLRPIASDLKFTDIEKFLDTNPKFIDHIVKIANNLVLPDGRGLWAQSKGIEYRDGKTSFYEWPRDHLPIRDLD